MGGIGGDGYGVEAGESETDLHAGKLFQTPLAPPTPPVRFVRCSPRAAGGVYNGNSGERNEMEWVGSRVSKRQ